MGLLIDDRCVIVQPSLVRELGRMSDAALLQQVHYWMPHATVEHEGAKWVYKSYDEWGDEIGLTRNQVRRSMERLEKLGVVISAQPRISQWDHQKWYRIDYDHPILTARPVGQNCPPEVANLPGQEGETARSSSSEKTTESTEEETSADAAVDERPEVERLCLLLADSIESNGSKRPNVTKRWRDACRLMMDNDGRSERQVQNMIEWCQGNEFWRGNILSMSKLRDKYDQMRLQAQRDMHAQRAEPRGNDGIRDYLSRKGLAPS